jgi:hypothetical protein
LIGYENMQLNLASPQLDHSLFDTSLSVGELISNIKLPIKGTDLCPLYRLRWRYYLKR